MKALVWCAGLALLLMVGCATTPATRASCVEQARLDFDRCAAAARRGAIGPAADGVTYERADPNTTRDLTVVDRSSCASAYERALEDCSKIQDPTPEL